MAAARDLGAFVVVAGVPALLVFAGYGLWRWGRWMVLAGRVGIIGLALTVVTVGNLGVPRTCDDGVGIRNRPVLAAVTEPGACRRSGMAQVDLALLTGLAATLLVLAISPSEPEVPRRA